MKLLLESAIIFFGTLIAAALLALGEVPVGDASRETSVVGTDPSSDTASLSVQAPR